MAAVAEPESELFGDDVAGHGESAGGGECKRYVAFEDARDEDVFGGDEVGEVLGIAVVPAMFVGGFAEVAENVLVSGLAGVGGEGFVHGAGAIDFFLVPEKVYFGIGAVAGCGGGVPGAIGVG